MNITIFTIPIPKKKTASLRHKSVKRLVFLSLSVTSIFGINSFFFTFSQNSLDGTISHIEALEALKTSSATDQISTVSKLNKESEKCSDDFPKQCEGYFEALIQVRNRMEDYKITFEETLGLKADHKLISQLSKVSKQTDLLASEAFKLSFLEAKNKKISTAAEYINSLNRDSLKSNEFLIMNQILNRKINILYSEVSEWIDNEFTVMVPLPALDNQLNIAFLVLVSTEISLFLLVCITDFLNNNVDSESQAKQNQA